MVKFFISLVLCFFALHTLTAQRLSFNAYTPTEGLVDARVNKIFQDSRGVMYFLTPDGFSVFDGQRFQNFTQYHNQPLSLVIDILEEKDGRILITSVSGIYFLQDNKLVKNTTLFPKSIGPGTIHITPSGEKIVEANSGLMIYNSAKATPIDLKKEVGTTQSLTLDKTILAGDVLGVIYSNPKLNRQYLAFYNWKQQKLITETASEPGMTLAAYDDKIYVYIKKEWHELNMEELTKGKLAFIPLHFSSLIPTGKKISTFYIDRQKKVWVFTTDKQLYMIDTAKKLTIHYSATNGLPEGTNWVFQDRENNYWLTVAGKGVYKMTQSRVEKFAFPDKNNSRNIQFYINKSPEGVINFKLGSNLGVINNTIFTKIKLNEKPGVNQVFIWNKLRWTLYYNYRLESEKGDIIQLASVEPGTKPSSGRVSFDKTGRLLIAGSYLSVVNKDLTFATTELPYFADNIVTVDDNNYWCFTRSANIVCYRLQDNRLLLQQTYKDTTYSSRFAYQWNKDTFCIGTRHHGIVFIKINSHEYKKLGSIGKENGLSNNFVVDIIRLNQHKLAVASVPGLNLVHLNKEDTAVEQLFSRAGLFTTVSSIQLMNDSLLVALDGGGSLYNIHVSSSSLQPVNPTFYFSRVTVNGNEIDTTRRSYRYTENNFRFSVSAPSFIDEKNIRFVFNLTGPGTDAVQNSKRADFEYSNLQPGSYTLSATAFFPGDEPMSKTISYSFTIKKPFWKTVGFIAGLIAFIALLLYAYFKNILRRRLEHQKIELEKQQAIADERSRIATDMHDDLGAGISTIKFLSQTAPYIPAEQQQQNNIKISEQADELVDKMNDIIWAMNEKNDTLDNLIFYTKAWVANYVEQHQLQPHITIPASIVPLIIRGEKRQHIFMCIKESIHNIIKHAEAKNMWLDMKIADYNLYITIRDDGKGFDIKKSFSGSGLSNMQKRIKAVNGEIKTLNDKGTVQLFTIPLK
jgi:signal transduction histidine kinase